MNAFDYSILLFLNQLGEAQPLFTKAVVYLYRDDLKTALMGALLWYVWFSNDGKPTELLTRERVVAVLIASALCVVLVRIAAWLLPFRARPIVIPGSGLSFPIDPGGWIQWSSFPSDHAVMFGMIATGLFIVSRPAGIIAVLDVLFLICFPRIFVGVHHPSDILVGLLVGVAAGYFVCLPQVSGLIARPFMVLLRRRKPLFYAAAFSTTFLFAQVYWPVTKLAVDVKHLLQSSHRPVQTLSQDNLPTKIN